MRIKRDRATKSTNNSEFNDARSKFTIANQGGKPNLNQKGGSNKSSKPFDNGGSSFGNNSGAGAP